jgi:hypothetical protein
MNFLYKTLTYSGNPDAEYQYRGSKGWYKRKKGSKGEWYAVQSDKVSILDKELKGKGFFNYSMTAKVGGALLIGIGAFLIYSRFAKK